MIDHVSIPYGRRGDIRFHGCISAPRRRGDPQLSSFRGRPERTVVVYMHLRGFAMICIRHWHDDDSISTLTQLLHRAYRPLADAGMRFVASYQDESVTRQRIAKGVCFIAQESDNLIGTIVYYPPGTGKGCDWYEQAGVGYFGQFAVEPACQRGGVGSQLLDHVEQYARENHAAELALDTSERAASLIAYYARRGYRQVGHVQWRDTNYRSVVMSKALCVTLPG